MQAVSNTSRPSASGFAGILSTPDPAAQKRYVELISGFDPTNADWVAELRELSLALRKTPEQVGRDAEVVRSIKNLQADYAAQRESLKEARDAATKAVDDHIQAQKLYIEKWRAEHPALVEAFNAADSQLAALNRACLDLSRLRDAHPELCPD